MASSPGLGAVAGAEGQHEQVEGHDSGAVGVWASSGGGSLGTVV